jgi:hypothetical protein
MVSSVLVDALSDPTQTLLELYDPKQDIDNFPAKVASHFATIFGSKDAFSEVPFSIQNSYELFPKLSLRSPAFTPWILSRMIAAWLGFGQ